MSNYEGKTYYRKRGHVDMIDLFYYEATGEALSPQDKKELLESMEKNAAQANEEIQGK